MVLIILGASLLACGNNDLSELNDRFQAQQAAEFSSIFRVEDLELTSDQVVSETPVMVDDNVYAELSLTIDYYDGSIRGDVYSPTIEPESIGLYEGQAGLNGTEILSFEWDAENPDTWRVPADKKLSVLQLEQLNNAELYVQLNTTNSPQGVLRTQVYLPNQEVLTVKLSGETFESHAPLDAEGKAYMTIEYGDDISIRGIVRISNMTQPTVALVRVNSPNNRQVLQTLAPVEDYYQLPADTILDNGEFNGVLLTGKLYFIAASADPMIGEIAGKVTRADSGD